MMKSLSSVHNDEGMMRSFKTTAYANFANANASNIHEAAITFLGFGLSVQTPSIGLILSEAVKYISIGKWWLAVFPGLLLVIVIKSFDDIGEECRILANPFSANE